MINTVKHETCGCSPNYCNFGLEYILYTEHYALAMLNSSQDPTQLEKARIKAVQNIQQFIIGRIKAAHESSKQRFDLRVWSRRCGDDRLSCPKQQNIVRRSWEQSSYHVLYAKSKAVTITYWRTSRLQRPESTMRRTSKQIDLHSIQLCTQINCRPRAITPQNLVLLND